jgi:hypothetical protein
MYKYELVFKNGDVREFEYKNTRASVWFLLWTNLGVKVAHELVDEVQFIVISKI